MNMINFWLRRESSHTRCLVTGCETTSSFFRKGKKITAWETWKSYPDVTTAFVTFALDPFLDFNRQSQIFGLLQRFTVVLYIKGNTHPFSLMQLHFISSIHALVAIHLVIQTGHHLPQLSFHFLPHDVAAGIYLWLDVQMLAWYAARLACWNSASVVGGKFSMSLLSRQKCSFLSSSICFSVLPLIYRTTVNLWRRPNIWDCLLKSRNGSRAKVTKAVVTSG